jgi:hypothetical protein
MTLRSAGTKATGAARLLVPERGKFGVRGNACSTAGPMLYSVQRCHGSQVVRNNVALVKYQ